MVSFTHEQNIICSQTQLDDISHEQTIVCKQLCAGHVVSSRPMKGKIFASNDNKFIAKMTSVAHRCTDCSLAHLILAADPLTQPE